MQFNLSRLGMASSLVALVVLLSVTPFAASANTGPTSGVQSCTVNWSLPHGTYTQGETETASITTNCMGNGAWLLCQINPPSVLTCLKESNIVAHGLFSCPCPNGYTFFNMQLPVGHYLFVAIVGTHIMCKNLAVAPFQVVTPQFPAGVLTAVATPMAALGGFWLLAKRRQAKI